MILYMAERALEVLPIPSPRRHYPWEEWMDGSTWLLEQGVDFGATVVSFRNRCYSKATSVGMNATVNVIVLSAVDRSRARTWLNAHDHDVPESATQLYVAIERHYPGGWAQFERDHTHHAETHDAGDSVIVKVRFYDPDAPVGRAQQHELGIGSAAA